MQHRLGTLFLILSLFVPPTNAALACSDQSAATEGQASTEKSCCSDASGKRSAGCSSETEGCAKEHPGQKCPDTDGCGGCHCPGCGTIGSAPTAFTTVEDVIPALLPFDETMSSQAFYFAEHLPEDVHLPIWQPPKIGA